MAKEGFVADIAPETPLRNVVERYPAAKVVLSRYGFEAYEEADPPRESVARFAEDRGISVERLLEELKRVVDIMTKRRLKQTLVPDETANEAILQQFLTDGPRVGGEATTGSAGSSDETCLK